MIGKMSKCPKCKKKITELDWSEYAIIHGTFNKNSKYSFWGSQRLDKSNKNIKQEFFCPECGERVAKTERTAKKILKVK